MPAWDNALPGDVLAVACDAYEDRAVCGEINAPIAMGNAVIRPGDILVVDGDGLVAISRDEAETVAERAHTIRDEGMRKLAAIGKTGKLNFNWLYEKLAASSCAILD